MKGEIAETTTDIEIAEVDSYGISFIRSSVFNKMWKVICTFTLQITDTADLLKSLAV